MKKQKETIIEQETRRKIMKKITKLILTLSLFVFAIPIRSAQALSSQERLLAEEQLKYEIVELFPEKFKTREDISTMTLAEIEARAGTYSKLVYNGDSVTQADVFISAFKGAGWATSATGYIDYTQEKGYTISISSSKEWDCKARVEATVTYSNRSAITHHVKVEKGKICSIGIFADVTAKEYTGYIYDNYTNALLSTYKGTLRVAEGSYLDGIYHGQSVKKFYNVNYTINKSVDR